MMVQTTAVPYRPPLHNPPARCLDHRTIRVIEKDSIRAFVAKHREHLAKGRVLDFGAGDSPYREYVAGEYLPYDPDLPMPEGRFDAILCTQVMQYIQDPNAQIEQFAARLKPGGMLVLTYPTNWDEVEIEDYWRFTKSGMAYLLEKNDFRILSHEKRAEVNLGGFRFPLGYGVVAELDGRWKKRTSLGPDASVNILTRELRRKRPFVFLKYGDGALECIYGVGRFNRTCDNEYYSPELGAKLLEAWQSIMQAGNVYAGDWLSAIFSGGCRGHEYADEYDRLIASAPEPQWLNFECLLLMRLTEPLRDFYQAVADDPRKKVIVGRPEMVGAGRMLRAEHIQIPMTTNLLPHVDGMVSRILESEAEVVLYGAGMAGNIAIAEVLKKRPKTTCISIGSALDPLFVPKPTRTNQMSQQECRAYFRDLLK